MWQGLQDWTSRTDVAPLALVLFALLCVGALVGAASRRFRPREESDDSQVGYVVSAVLGLLALLMGFTFSLAVDRYDARRLLVLEEANAIGTAYLRAQLLEEPHRARMSDLLVRYTDNRIALAKADPGGPEIAQRMAANDALITDIWAATSAAFDTIKGIDFSSTFVDSINHVVDLDASRKIARAARVPFAVTVVLLVYLIVTAGVLGYVLERGRGRLAAGFLLGLLTLSLVLIIDINRPTGGNVTESQLPMEQLRKSLAATPPATFDKWKSAAPAAAP